MKIFQLNGKPSVTSMTHQFDLYIRGLTHFVSKNITPILRERINEKFEMKLLILEINLAMQNKWILIKAINERSNYLKQTFIFFLL